MVGNGCVIPGTPIAIDFWRISKSPQAKVFLLTHCHSDHIEGLTKTWRYNIYTTSFNAKWLAAKRQVPPSLFTPLEAGVTTTVALDACGTHTAEVTAIDASHIPGAVMFLLQGYFGTILYCGDTRYYPALVAQPRLCDLAPGDVTNLYLDNTYCHPRYDFPSRQWAARHIVRIIEQHPHHHIRLGSRTIGREELYVLIALVVRERLLVTQDYYHTLGLMEAPDVFTTDKAESRIHLVPMRSINESNHEMWNNEHPTISISPTALFHGGRAGPYIRLSDNDSNINERPKDYDNYTQQMKDTNQTRSGTKGLYSVPYSDHSSYAELREMVRVLKPCRVTPIVRSDNLPKFTKFSNLDMNCFDDLLFKDEISQSQWESYDRFAAHNSVKVVETNSNMSSSSPLSVFRQDHCGIKSQLSGFESKECGNEALLPETNESNINPSLPASIVPSCGIKLPFPSSEIADCNSRKLSSSASKPTNCNPKSSLSLSKARDPSINFAIPIEVQQFMDSGTRTPMLPRTRLPKRLNRARHSTRSGERGVRYCSPPPL